MLKFQEFLKIMKGIQENKSLCRILQNNECKKVTISGDIIEFGADPTSTKNFYLLAKKKKIKKIFFSDKNIKKKNVLNVDLNKKKFFLKKNRYDTILFFNVMEHLTNIDNAKNQLQKTLKKRGKLVGSTPFLYRFHGAPSDYLRYTKPFLNFFFKNEFKILQIKNLGFGPFCLCFSFLSDFTKKIPFLNLVIFPITFLLDFILNKFVRYELKNIYPIAIFFILEKK